MTRKQRSMFVNIFLIVSFIISVLHFIFGKNHVDDNLPFVPGSITSELESPFTSKIFNGSRLTKISPELLEQDFASTPISGNVGTFTKSDTENNSERCYDYFTDV